MKTLAAVSIAVLLVFVAACSPADGVPVAFAQPYSASVALWPDPAPGAGDGQVHEYH
jgi:hypothetical protein